MSHMGLDFKHLSQDSNAAITQPKEVYILPIVKSAQQKHGLRHENYQRYSGYCTRRLRRLRRSLKYTHTHKCLPNRPARFVLRPVTVEQLSNPRFIELCVFQVERCWSFAQHLKLELVSREQPTEKLRKKFHMRQKMRRAVMFARTFQQLVSSFHQATAIVQQVHPHTRTEITGYAAFIEACLRVEQRNWLDAAQLFATARSAYLEIAGGLKEDTDLNELYTARSKEMDDFLKLCKNECAATVPEDDGRGANGGGGTALTMLAVDTADSLNFDVYAQDVAAATAATSVSRPLDKRQKQSKQTGSKPTKILTLEKTEKVKKACDSVEQPASKKLKESGGDQNKILKKERSAPLPMKPFFFDLALNFVDDITPYAKK